MSDVDLARCEWMKTDADERDPDGCEECEWETWRCHDAAIDAARLVANPNATVTRDWLARLANGAAIAAEGRIHLDRPFLAAQADLLHAIVKELPEGDIAFAAAAFTPQGTIVLTDDEQATLDRALDRMENFGLTPGDTNE